MHNTSNLFPVTTGTSIIRSRICGHCSGGHLTLLKDLFAAPLKRIKSGTDRMLLPFLEKSVGISIESLGVSWLPRILCLPALKSKVQQDCKKLPRAEVTG